MFTEKHGCLEISIYLVARIFRNGEPFYMRCRDDEWEPRPGVDFKLYRVIEITRDPKSPLAYEKEVWDAQGPLPELRCDPYKWWKYSSEDELFLRIALNKKTHKVFGIGVSPDGNKFKLHIGSCEEPAREFEQASRPVERHAERPVEPVKKVEEKAAEEPAKEAVETQPELVPIVATIFKAKKPKPNNGNGTGKGKGKDRDEERLSTKAFLRTKKQVPAPETSSPRARSRRKSALQRGSSATLEEIERYKKDTHELSGRMDLNVALRPA